MLQFIKPLNLNGAELLEELNAAGVMVTANPMLDGNANLWLDIKPADEAKATPIVAAHNGTTTVPDNSANKAALLAKLGITADEARLLLS